MIIFGASGDLARRKLVPALYHLAVANLLDESFAVLGVARDSMTDDQYRELMRAELEKSDGFKSLDERAWKWLAGRMWYSTANFVDPATFPAIADKLRAIDGPWTGAANHLFYLAIPPSVFPATVTNLASSGLMQRTSSSSGCSVRQMSTCGERPISRSFAIDCCDGFVFSSPAALM